MGSERNARYGGLAIGWATHVVRLTNVWVFNSFLWAHTLSFGTLAQVRITFIMYLLQQQQSPSASAIFGTSHDDVEHILFFHLLTTC